MISRIVVSQEELARAEPAHAGNEVNFIQTISNVKLIPHGGILLLFVICWTKLSIYDSSDSLDIYTPDLAVMNTVCVINVYTYLVCCLFLTNTWSVITYKSSLLA